MNSDKKILLSICIPTYNRLDILKKNVEDLLKCENDKFEIVILDNCSDDDTFNFFTSYNDSRVRIIKNDFNVGGIKNPIKALTMGTGIYSMLLLDKDRIEFNYLSTFIEFLEQNSKLALGYCELNKSNDKLNIFANYISSSKNETFLRFAYQARHPSGIFFNSTLYKDDFIVDEILKDNFEVFGFYFDLISANISLLGSGAIYNNSLVFTEPPELAAEKKTLTYNKDNIFFSPKNRYIQYKKYMSHLKSLKLGYFFKLKLKLRLKKQGLYFLTKGYFNSINYSEALSHYNLKKSDFSYFDCLKYVLLFLYA